MNGKMVAELTSAAYTFYKCALILDRMGLGGDAESALDYSAACETVARKLATVHPVEVPTYLRRVGWNADEAGAALATARAIVKSARLVRA